MSEDPASPYDALVEVVLDDVAATIRRLEDRAVNRAREDVNLAEEHVDALARAGRELGDVRGRAASEAFEREADVEIRDVVDGAFDRLFDRFLLRVRTALEGLRGQPRYLEALGAWARTAATVMDRPADVFAAPEDREALYDALIAAGAEDFQIHVDRGVRVGLVVRDLDGRTLLDRRPEAIVAEREIELRKLLKASVPQPPSAVRPT